MIIVVASKWQLVEVTPSSRTLRKNFGKLKKPRRRRQRQLKGPKELVLWAKLTAVHVHHITLQFNSTFLLHPLDFCDVKPSNAVRRYRNFPFSFKTWKVRIQLQEKSPTFDKLGGLHGWESHDNRLQNIDSVFCVFKKARTVKLKVWRFLRYYNATLNLFWEKTTGGEETGLILYTRNAKKWIFLNEQTLNQ